MSRAVYGAGPVAELVRSRAKHVSVLYVSGKRAKGEVAADARNRGISVELANNRELDGLAGQGARHQGLVALAGDYEYVDLDDMLAQATGSSALILALDSVQDPRNLGAIARSAYLLGAQGIVIPRDRAAEVTAVATKTSAGATEHLAIAQVTNLTRALAELKEAGLWITGVDATADAVPLASIDFKGPSCLVLGAEGAGMRPRVASACDHIAVIAMAGAAVGSFNVSVAASIALYEAARQRA